MLAVDVAVFNKVLDEGLEVFDELLTLEFLLFEGQEVYFLDLDLRIRSRHDFCLNFMGDDCFFVDFLGYWLGSNRRSMFFLSLNFLVSIVLPCHLFIIACVPTSFDEFFPAHLISVLQSLAAWLEVKSSPECFVGI